MPNVFDLTYDVPREQLFQPFQDQDYSKKFLGMRNATNRKEVGLKFPQVDKMNTEKAYSLSTDSFGAEDLRFDEIRLFDSAKLTDLLSCVHITAHAYLLSDKAVQIFEKFNLGSYRLYPATVEYKGEKYSYQVLQFINPVDTLLDFLTTQFCANKHEYLFDVPVKDYAELQKVNAELYLGGYADAPRRSRAVLKKGVFAHPEKVPNVFSISHSLTWRFVSVELAQAIVDAELTGFEFTKSYEFKD